MDILDLSIAASMAAFDLESAWMSKFLSQSGWQIVGSSQKRDLVTFYDLYHPALNVSVITIRGTSSRLADLIQDFNLYSEVAILQIMSLVPGLRLWPQETTAKFVAAMDKVQDLFLNEETDHYYFHSVVDYVRNIHTSQTTSAVGPRKVVVVGHSLGGSLAKIAGCLTNTQAVGFSSPGILLSRRKFGIEKHDVQSLVTNVYAENDIVPWVDQMGGIMQQVQCPDGLWCHRMSNIICELWRKCPNRKNEGSHFIPPSFSLGGGCNSEHLLVFT
jgi:lipase ATG15